MRHDPHSYADLEQGRTTAVRLKLRIDFEARVCHGEAELTFEEAVKGVLDLDARELHIVRVEDSEGRSIPFELGDPDPVLGSRLRLTMGHASTSVTLHYRTHPAASALMWLTPEQTNGGVHPFVLTQCQAIHARSIVPLQDTPAARISYRAQLDIPADLSAVMSAGPGEARVEGDRRVLDFAMPQPIPPYLLAFAVGELASADLGPRCRVFAEPGVLESAAWEFAEVSSMLETAEGLFGPYVWDRYDFVVLPPSFPMGGMENPRMTFLTPTLLAGDRSLVGVLAHELAHSWTGNLVTNATNEDFWLNEGWTVWAERRILERLYGAEEATQQAILGRRSLEAVLAERTSRGENTALHYPQLGLDPDETFSQIPYEKGFLVVTALERAVGRERFDGFVATYIEHFAFQSITTPDFIAFVDAELPDHGVDLAGWTTMQGLPDDAPSFASARLDELAGGTVWTGLSTTESLFVLGQLMHHSSVDAGAVGQAMGIDGDSNAELRCAWLSLALRAGTSGLEPALCTFIDTIGRAKLIKPLIGGMAARDDLRALAETLVARNTARWHTSTNRAVQAVLADVRRAQSQ